VPRDGKTAPSAGRSENLIIHNDASPWLNPGRFVFWRTVYVGAGTHDIGFEEDVRSGHLTHKIDPEVDGERENIAQSLDKSGKVKSMTYYLPPDPVQDAKNASGGGYHSDGRLLVVFLQ